MNISLSGDSQGFILVDPSPSQLNSEKKTRQSLIDRVVTSKIKIHAMPMAGSSNFQTFRTNFELDLRGSAWHPRGKWILDYPTTDLSDPIVLAVSADLATLLVYCARSTGEECRGQLLGSDGRELLKQSLGCELWQRVLRIFNPSGIRATWDNHDVFSKVSHKHKEGIESLANMIVETADLLASSSSGLIPANSFSNKLKLAQYVCLGPYNRAFESILDAITVTQKDEWDLTVPSLRFELLTTRLGDHLRRSQYMTPTGLKNGHSLTPTATARMAINTFDKWGQVD